MRQKGALVWVGLFLVAVVVGFVARPGRSDGVPLDPRSTAPDGARALRELLDRYADDVGTSSIDESTDTLIVLEDSLDADSDEAVLAWVRDGGHLIWLDNRSTFTPLRPEGASIANADGRQVVKGVCSIEALADLSALSAPSIRLFATDGVAASCFGPSAAGTPGGTTAVAQYRFDRGRVTVVGGATLVDNAHIAEADNAAMIVRLATSDGARRVVLWHPATITMGPEVDPQVGLFDLVPARVNVFLMQLVVATGLWLWFRGRRFGKVVAEPQLVEIPASLLVRSSAELQRRAKGDEWAAAALRSDFSARLRTEHRLGPDTPPDLVATVVAQRTGYPADALMAIMVDRSGGEPDLAELVTRIDHATPNVFTQAPVSAGRPSSLSSGSHTP